jgi:predicted alpha/beta superfamily hydrolase
MSKIFTFTILLITGIQSLYAQNDVQLVIGTQHEFYSDILDESRTYWVSLPESYNEETSSYKRYPILIVLDGHAHFKSIAGMVNYMSTGYNGNRRIPEMIVVAIKNVNRNRDFTPDKLITTRENNTGGGDKFLSFLEDELIPKLDQELRTMPYRILYGHSLGGLLATHTYMKEKTIFNSFIAVDPSFGTWDAETMDKKLDAVTDHSFDRFIYIATANWGKRNIRNRDRHLRWFETLNSKCKRELPAKLEYFENENHGSVPVMAFHNGISSIFRGYGISYRTIKNTAQLTNHFRSLSQRLSWDINPPEALVNQVGYNLLRSKSEEDKLNALAFFILNTENYPASFNAYDSLAEIYEAFGDKEKATNNYKKSLELNPNNEHAKMRIESMKNTK